MKVRKHLPTVLIAMVVAAITAGAPAIADGVRHALFAHNADKVDGKHAVGSTATLNQAAGKLVATDRSGSNKGRLSPKFLAKVDAASLARTTDFPIEQGGAFAIPFNVEEFDNAGLHSNSTNATRLTARSAGLYHVSASVAFSVANSGYRQVYIRKNGNLVEYHNGPHSGDTYFTSMGVDTVLRLAKGDYVEVAAWSSAASVSVLGNGTCPNCTGVTMHRVGQY